MTTRRKTRTPDVRAWLPTAALCLAIAWAVPVSARSPDPRDPAEIDAQVEAIVGPEVESWCRAKGVTYPPQAVLLRIFKRERELEVWARNRGQKTMQLLHRSAVCAMDFAPGPKLVEGDGKTPEGFYHPDFLYPSPNWWMWIDLANVDAPGRVGKGSAFRMCVDYPNALDRRRTRAAGRRSAGGGICLHGNCVSIGCASFTNRDFLPIFALARRHDERTFGKLQLHVLPFRFERVGAEERAALADAYVHRGALGRQDLLRFWENLEQGYDAFNADPNPLPVTIGDGGYVFGRRR